MCYYFTKFGNTKYLYIKEKKVVFSPFLSSFPNYRVHYWITKNSHWILPLVNAMNGNWNRMLGAGNSFPGDWLSRRTKSIFWNPHTCGSRAHWTNHHPLGWSSDEELPTTFYSSVQVHLDELNFHWILIKRSKQNH